MMMNTNMARDSINYVNEAGRKKNKEEEEDEDFVNGKFDGRRNLYERSHDKYKMKVIVKCSL